MFSNFDLFDLCGTVVFLGMAVWFAAEWVKADRDRQRKEGAAQGRAELQAELHALPQKAPLEVLDVLGGLFHSDAFTSQQWVEKAVSRALHTKSYEDCITAMDAINDGAVDLRGFPGQTERLRALQRHYGWRVYDPPTPT